MRCKIWMLILRARFIITMCWKSRRRHRRHEDVCSRSPMEPHWLLCPMPCSNTWFDQANCSRKHCSSGASIHRCRTCPLDIQTQQLCCHSCRHTNSRRYFFAALFQFNISFYLFLRICFKIEQKNRWNYDYPDW